jgi:cyclase
MTGYRPRVIPALLLHDRLLYKTRKFKAPRYVGDPRIALRIFNEKGVDELILLDIDATTRRRGPDLALIGELASECFMPVAYGGGVRSVEDVRAIIGIGVEKVVIGTRAVDDPALIAAAAAAVGSQSVVVCIDVKKDLLGRYRVHAEGGRRKTGLDPVAFARRMVQMGAGEIVVNAIDRDGTMGGFDLTLLRSVSAAVPVPVVALGGAGDEADLAAAVFEGGASAAAAGSLFVFHGPHRAVLITFPEEQRLRRLFQPPKVAP